MRGQSRRNFTKDEDVRLKKLVSQYGEDNWESISGCMPGRTPRSVKERWTTYLSPKVNNGPYTQNEDALLVQKFCELGPRWVEISKCFVGRSDNSLKNRWYTHLSKRLDNFDSTPEPEIEETIPKTTIDEQDPMNYMDEPIFDVYHIDFDWSSFTELSF